MNHSDPQALLGAFDMPDNRLLGAPGKGFKRYIENAVTFAENAQRGG